MRCTRKSARSISAWQVFEPDEIFTEDEIESLLSDAERRIVVIFQHAVEFRRGRYIGTDNYIIGISHRVSELARHVSREVRNPIVDHSDIERSFGDVSRSHAKKQAMLIQTKLIAEALVLARSNANLWYDEATGIWQLAQSFIDEHEARHQVAKALKFDRRTEHGQVRSQRIARDRPAGVSVSLASGYIGI